MGLTMKDFVVAGLPEIEAEATSKDAISEEAARENLAHINALTLWLILALAAVFVGFYALALARFTPATRSLNLHPSFLAIFAWGAISAGVYFVANKKKLLYVCLPGIIVGGGAFLGLLSFSLELMFSGIVLQTNLAVISTTIFIHLFNYYKIFDRFKGSERLVVGLASFVLNAALAYFAYQSFKSIFINAPKDPIYPIRGLVFSTLGIILTTILGTLHLKEMGERCKRQLSFNDKAHFAMSSYFIVFSLYLGFLLLIGFTRKK